MEDDNEPQDPKPALEEDCKHSAPCLPLLRALQDCQTRVANNPGTGETCQQELFDLLPCVDDCVFSHIIWTL